MIDSNTKLNVKHDNDSTFVDFSNEAIDYGRDNFSITLTTNDFIYIGFRKPINSLFIGLATVTSEVNELAGEFYNGTTWVALADFFDETKGFNRDGFINWSRNQTDEAKVTVDSVEKFWYRISSDNASLVLVFTGINIVFSDDQDLKREHFEISEFLPTGETSHILTHMAARDQIVQVLRNSGNFTSNNGTRKDITAFDLHDVGQVRLAATYLALSKIFSSVIDDPDDVFKQKAEEFKTNYSIAVKTPFIDIDNNDDGLKSASENKQFRTTRIFRE